MAVLTAAAALLATAATATVITTATPTPPPTTTRTSSPVTTIPTTVARAVCLVAVPMAAAPGSGGQARAVALAQLAEIGVPAAWPSGRGRGQGVTVAVLDTGVDPAVPDLAGSVRTGPDYTVGVNPRGYRPPHWHGTYIASLIAGHGSGPGGASGIIGVAPAARILSVRVILDDQEPGFPVYNANQHYKNALARGVRYAVRHGAQVINMSLGAASGSRQLRAAIGSAIAHGVVVVASAGNGGAAAGRFSAYSYPASYTGVISVAAVGPDHRRAPFSDRNSSVVLAAPGVRVVGDAPGGGYVAVNGTSPASAFVAGVAALIRSRYPQLAPDQVRQAMIRSATHRPPDGYGPGAGFGEADAAAAVVLAGRLADAGPDPGLASGAHFGPGPPGPVLVTHRDRPRIASAERDAAAGLLVFLAGLLAIAVILCRAARRTRGRPVRAFRATAGSGSRSRRL
jgi:subtilisin family serine protease